MVIGLLIVSAIPTTVGVAQAISAQKKADAAQKEKAKFHMTTTELSIQGGPAEEPFVVLAGGKLYIDHPDAPRPGHKFTGFYFTYPGEAQVRGVVSSIQDDPPMLNWVYADRDTGELRYGGRKDTAGHVVGPFGWSADEQWLTVEGDAGRFVAVEEDLEEGYDSVDEDGRENRKWAVYLARNRDGTMSRDEKVQEGKEEEENREKGKEAGGQDGGGTNEEEKKEKKEKKVDVRQCREWAPIKLRRRLQMGMESKYVKAEKEKE